MCKEEPLKGAPDDVDVNMMNFAPGLLLDGIMLYIG